MFQKVASNGCRKDVKIITGRGVHSKSPKLQRRVVEVLQNSYGLEPKP